jgi:cytochrome P450
MPADAIPPFPAWPMPRSCPMLPPDDYGGLRTGPPIKVRLRDGDAWLLTRYEHVRAILADLRFSSDDQRPGFPLRIQLPPDPGIQTFFRMDPPEQSRLRKMAMTEFTARRTRLLRPAIEKLVGQLLDDLAALPKPTDLVEAFTLKLPSLVIARLLGVPDEDQGSFTEQSRMILSQVATPQETYAAYVAMSQYIDDLATRREQEPLDDMLSRFATQFVATGQLSHEELVSIARFFLIAGHETTSNQLCLSVLSLLLDPAQREYLANADQSGAEGAVEELLRYWSVSQDNIVRLAIEDVEVGGAQIRAGDAVVIALNGADHDERVFADAARVDLTRENARQHLAFGHGPHLCPGAPLARTELVVGIVELFSRFPTLQLAVPFAELSFRENTLIYGINELPVTW